MKSFFSGKKKIFNEDTSDNCEKCKLYQGCNTPRMGYTGKGKKKILIIAEASGFNEDQLGEQLVGDAGQFLREELSLHDIDIDIDCWKINAIGCRPPKNRTPSDKEIKLCKPRVDAVIEELKPEFIWLLGGVAVKSMYMGRFSDCSITRWRRLCIPDKKTGAWIIPMYHPSYPLRMSWDKNLQSTFRKDMKFAISCLRKIPPRFKNYEEDVELGLDYKNVVEFLNSIIANKWLIVVDFETTGLKPQAISHKIWSCSITTENSITPSRTVAFPISYPYWDDRKRDRIISLLVVILEDPEIEKVAQNIMFESIWSDVILDTTINGWRRCTMNSEHIIDSRQNFCKLKFQAYIRFGLEGYDKDIKAHIAPKKGKLLNTLDQVPIEKLLLYNGIDTRVEYDQFKRQERILGKKGDKRGVAYDLTHKGLIALVDAELTGIPIDELYYIEQKQSILDEVEKVEKLLLNGKEAKLFKKKKGRKFLIKNKDFSTIDLRTMFFEVLKKKPKKETKSGAMSVDADTLESLNSPFADLVLRRRKLLKIKDTYIAQFEREIVNGRIHPFSDLHTTQSYRSSMSKPSFQNIPVRDKEAKKIIRRGIIPPHTFRILCADYGAMEVRIIACYSKDRLLIKYIVEGGDPHKDEAKHIFVLTDETVTSEIRSITKNQFVFPEFYGSYYVSCAKGFWENCKHMLTGDQINVFQHLVNIGVMRKLSDYDGFENHIKEVETNFWERFPYVREWQEKEKRFYRKHGYVEMKTGYRRSGLLNDNMIINTPIQGTAFHCLLWSYVQLNNIRKRRMWKTQMLAQIHDEILFGLHPKELKKVITATKKVMEKDILEKYEWLIVPLEVEIEMTKVDESWFHKKKFNV